MESISDLWDKTLEIIEKKVSKPSFDTWLKSTRAHSLENDVLTVIAPNIFARDWLENRYSELISEIIHDLTGSFLQIYFITPQHEENEININEKPKTLPKFEKEKTNVPKTILNDKYTFDKIGRAHV